ncbi:MATE family efflux transporter [Agathobaculum desmolans]|uniref:MATE family efflux transporter n=1 Tax=Agathobaculum desmolans TaxID=39484 RepID=UPI0004E2770B|nr:MATE family efflux transporter [Agathobaculum desmolans]
MTTDLTEGNPSRKLFWFSLPLLLSVAFQQLYQMADSMIVGRFAATPEAGELALAAVGASYPITQLFVAVATGVNIGTSVLVSQLFGAKRFLRMKTAISTALLTTTVIALVLTLTGALGTDAMMAALQTPDNIFADGSLYLRVYVFGLLFLFLYNVCTGIFNAMGDSRTPLFLLILSSVANVALDLLFVARFRWGVAGVAWATFIAQGGAGVLALILLLRRTRSFDTNGHFLLFSPDMLRRLTNYAVPSIAQQSFVSVGNVVIQFYVNMCGATVIAGFSAATKVNMFALTCCMSFASGLSSYVAQNIGARKLDRIGPGLKAGAAFSIGLALVFTAIYLPFAEQLVGLFIPAGSASGVTAVGRQFLFIVVPFYIIVCIKFVCDSVLRGAGAMRPFMVTTFSDLILRVGFTIVLFAPFREAGIWASWPLGWFLGSGLSVLFYKKGTWKKNLPAL